MPRCRVKPSPNICWRFRRPDLVRSDRLGRERIWELAVQGGWRRPGNFSKASRFNGMMHSSVCGPWWNDCHGDDYLQRMRPGGEQQGRRLHRLRCAAVRLRLTSTSLRQFTPPDPHQRRCRSNQAARTGVVGGSARRCVRGPDGSRRYTRLHRLQVFLAALLIIGGICGLLVTLVHSVNTKP